MDRWLAVLLMSAWCLSASAGGGAGLQEDRCVVEMSFQSAHLTLYQPETRGSEKFCDSVPDATHTVFTLDYLHDSLDEVPIELRVIRDTEGLGQFARWKDIQAMDGIEERAVFHQPPTVMPGGTFQAEHEFEQTGDYLILITTRHPTKDKVYHAVAPLEVGGTAWVYWAVPPGIGAFGLGFFWLRARRRSASAGNTT
jgi:hypothetical protein